MDRTGQMVADFGPQVACACSGSQFEMAREASKLGGMITDLAGTMPDWGYSWRQS